MKQCLALAICLLLCGCALAEGFQEPALKNPQDAYDFYIDQSDGSEELLYNMIDAMNDEATIVAENGALHLAAQQYDAAGEVYLAYNLILQESAFGRMIIFCTSEAGDIYTLDSGNYVMQNGELASSGRESLEDFDWYWESYCFPYGRLQTLNSMRQDENGYNYFLITSEEDMSFEYVTDSSMQIVQLRVYMRDDDGVLALDSTVDYQAGGARAIPPAVLRAMRADLDE